MVSRPRHTYLHIQYTAHILAGWMPTSNHTSHCDEYVAQAPSSSVAHVLEVHHGFPCARLAESQAHRPVQVDVGVVDHVAGGQAAPGCGLLGGVVAQVCVNVGCWRMHRLCMRLAGRRCDAGRGGGADNYTTRRGVDERPEAVPTIRPRLLTWAGPLGSRLACLMGS